MSVSNNRYKQVGGGEDCYLGGPKQRSAANIELAGRGIAVESARTDAEETNRFCQEIKPESRERESQVRIE